MQSPFGALLRKEATRRRTVPGSIRNKMVLGEEAHVSSSLWPYNIESWGCHWALCLGISKKSSSWTRRKMGLWGTWGSKEKTCELEKSLCLISAAKDIHIAYCRNLLLGISFPARMSLWVSISLYSYFGQSLFHGVSLLDTSLWKMLKLCASESNHSAHS